MITKLILATAVAAGGLAIDNATADDSNGHASVVIALVDEGGAPVTNAHVANLPTNGPFHSTDTPVAQVATNGAIAFDRPKSPWFLVSVAGCPSVITNVPLSQAGHTNRIILKHTPNKDAARYSGPAAPRT